MQIDVNDPNVFDKWRAAYHQMSDAEHLEFCDAAEAKWPTQQSFTFSNFERLFSSVNNHPSVVEIGGWKGELARKCLDKFKILEWTNIDFCKAAVDKTVDMKDHFYSFFCPSSIAWFRERRAEQFDICVSAHMIEHLSDEHLLELLGWISGIPLVMFEAPIGYTTNDWSGYYGTHILKMGWNRINAEMQLLGYDSERINDQCFVYRIKE